MSRQIEALDSDCYVLPTQMTIGLIDWFCFVIQTVYTEEFILNKYVKD